MSLQSPKVVPVSDEEVEIGILNSTDSNFPVKYQRKARASEVLFLGFSSLGAIYGDIGTSPLYTVSTILSSSSSLKKSDIYGSASCIFWIFTLVVIVKYALIVLFLGPNNGEGGQVAIYAKIARTLKIGPRGVKIPGVGVGGGKAATALSDMDEDLLTLTRTATGASATSNRNEGAFIKSLLSVPILVLCFIGCSLVISDGLLTPTTSVLSAVDGIAVAAPSLESKVLPISCVILLCLFIAQSLGSGKISILFAPVIFIWFICIFVMGCININLHPDIMKALSPVYAIDFLKDKGDIDTLAGVMLAVTGTEAMFADIGHFGKLPIQLTLIFFVYPCLMLTYLGQAAFLMEHPDAVENIFYRSIPGGVGSGFYWFVFVISTLATVIASQALILGVFSIVKQLIMLDCFPRFKVLHVSAKNTGQIFIPVVNYMLMVGVICTTVGFKTSAAVTAAYGLGVALDFFVTTILISIAMIWVFKFKFIIPLVFFAAFGALECTLVASGLKKVVHGAWFPLMMTVISFTFMSCWRWFRSLKVNNELDSVKSVQDMFVLKAPRGEEVLDLKRPNIAGREFEILPESEASEEEDIEEDINEGFLLFKNGVNEIPISRTKSVAFLYSQTSVPLTARKFLPELLSDILSIFQTLPQVLVVVETRVGTVPNLEPHERISLQKVEAIDGVYRCIIRSGFMQSSEIDNSLVNHILGKIEETRTFGPKILGTDMQLNTPLVHLFEKEVLKARGFTTTSSKWLNIIRRPGHLTRSMVIDHFLVPLNSAFQGLEEMLKIDNQDKNQEVIFIGKKTNI
ncbi:unnamed protein product [Kuraishia capsulata CBS 1993]|uniref:Potassium transporter n=1 Tax=Kuraishia capsulata CBS 1993 TaxID=1382522 RepID=W6MKV4_9ASCO|nr:uncharacterized protein KUCA_T00003091001 [Kuraishia capsulata CBS 1993]CDK27114.1 unnamed protein product [Kuraishia capsulata CBS 1993]